MDSAEDFLTESYFFSLTGSGETFVSDLNIPKEFDRAFLNFKLLKYSFAYSVYYLVP